MVATDGGRDRPVDDDRRDRRERVETFVANHPDASVMDVLARCHAVAPEHRDVVEDVLGRAGDHPDHLGAPTPDDEGVRRNGSADTAADSPAKGDSQDSNPGCEAGESPTVSPRAVREHYRRARPVYDALATVGDAPTIGLAGNGGWYRYQHEDELGIDELEAGNRVGRRPNTFDRDFNELVDGIDVDPDDSSWRSMYVVTSWKDPTAIYDRAFTSEYDAFESGEGLPDASALRALPFWTDVDLADDVKPRRGDLSAGEQRTIERAFEVITEEVAAIYDLPPEAIAAFDSGGGMYPWGPAAATLPIAERYDDPETRGRVFDELADRINAYVAGDGETAGTVDAYGFEGIVPRVERAVPGAAQLLDVDPVQNKNRQSKAPLSIHKNHDVVVAPLRDADGRVDYTPTRVSEVDDELVERTVAETQKITADTPETRACVEPLVTTLFPEYAGRKDVKDWRDALDAWLDDAWREERARIHERARAALRRRERRAGRDDSGDRQATAASGVTPDVHDLYAALGDLDPKRVADRTIVHRWNDDAATSDDARAFVPTWGKTANGTANIVDDEIWQDTGGEGGYGGPVVMALIDAGDLDYRTASPERANGARWYAGVEHLRGLGFDVPVHVPEAGAANGDGEEYEQTPLWALRKAAVALNVCDDDEFVEQGSEDDGTYLGFPDRETYNAVLDALDERGIDHDREHIDSGGRDRSPRQQGFVETCKPPKYDPVDVDREQRWRELRGERLDDWLARGPGTLEVFGDPAGDGKTTSVPLGLDDRDESHGPLLPQHPNCYEFTHDDAKPDGYYHHKGGGQPREECCMKADVEADESETPECPTHGHPSNWARMCPVHELDKDDPERARFEAIQQAILKGGTQRAHELLDPHDGEKCDWQRSHDTLANADKAVTVHNYLTQKTVQNVGKVVVDDLQQLPIDERTVSIPGLLAAANRMDAIGQPRGTQGVLTDGGARSGSNSSGAGRGGGAQGMLARFARFVRDVVDVMTGRFDDDPNVDGVEDLDPPEISNDEVRELREYQGTNFQRSRVTGHARAEVIARAKFTYNETVINRMRDERWEAGDEPLCFDAVIALAARAGLDSGPAYRAIAVPAELDSCPVCTADLSVFNGKRVCEGCGWDEESGLLVRPDDEKARAQVRVVPAEERDGGDPAVEYRTLPLPSELPAPEDTLVLDATPRPEVIGALFGCDPEDVVVTGNEPRQLNATVTQVANGQFHRSTIARDDKYGERLREKHQRWIDRRSETCEQFLVVSHKSNRRYYDLPENAEWMHFHAARGLDRSEYDGMVVIGAPHPNMEEVQRDAELLAMHREDVRVGGEEHSTRADAPNPPVYRKLLYDDENGEGRAVGTKHYTGLSGSLFRAGREDELEQVAHRVRPGQADPDDEKFIDLLTNVPTDLPVDQFVQLEEFTDPLSVMLPVPDGSVRLLGHVRDVLEGDGPDGFRARAFVEQRDDGTIANKVKGYHRLAQHCGEDVCEGTVRNWVRALEDVGLLTPEEYEQRAGVSYTVDFATLKSALQVVSSNADLKVPAVRRFREKVARSAGSLDWLAWAEAVFDLGGDRCEWDPPPTPGT